MCCFVVLVHNPPGRAGKAADPASDLFVCNKVVTMSQKMLVSEEVKCVLSSERVAAIKTWRDVIWVPNLPMCFAASTMEHLSTRCTLDDGSKSAQLPVLQRAVEAKVTSALLP